MENQYQKRYEYLKQYREKNKEILQQKRQEYYEQNKDKIQEYKKQYNEENRFLVRITK